MFPPALLASVKAEGKFMFLVYELFLGLSRGEETFDFGKCDGLRSEKRTELLQTTIRAYLSQFTSNPWVTKVHTS